jgi:CheY-like chemotaxis protein
VLADGDKLKQVFWNFSENAVRAMRRRRHAARSIESLGDDWQISFADTGTGMTRSRPRRFSNPFNRSFEGGTGLGLAVVYQIVQAHEGKVWARSKPGQGTTFILSCGVWMRSGKRRAQRLKIASPLPAADPRNWRLQRKGGGVANILVCDDERSICEMLDIALRREGHRVETVQSGQAAKIRLMALFTISSSPTSRCRTSTASKSCATPTASRPILP